MSEEVFQIGMGLGSRIMGETEPESLTVENEDESWYKAAMLFFIVKAFKSYQAIRLLWTSGYSEDAYMLARSIFELVLQAGYMAEDPIPRAKLFVEHDKIVRYRSYQRVKESSFNWQDQGVVQHIEARAQELDELKQHHKKHHHEYPKNRWWGDDIAFLARYFGEETDKYYRVNYWSQSDMLHSGISALKEYLKIEKGALQLNYQPFVPSGIEIPFFATLHFLGLATVTVNALGIGLDDECSEAKESLADIIARGDTGSTGIVP